MAFRFNFLQKQIYNYWPHLKVETLKIKEEYEEPVTLYLETRKKVR